MKYINLRDYQNSAIVADTDSLVINKVRIFFQSALKIVPFKSTKTNKQNKNSQLQLDELLEYLIIGSFWKSGAKPWHLDHWSWTHYPIVCKYESPSRAKSNYIVHWKLKGNRAFVFTCLDSQWVFFYFGNLQGLNWGQSWTKNKIFVYIPCLCKNSTFSKCSK